MTTDAEKEPTDVLLGGEPSGEKPAEPSAPPEMLTKDQAEKLADQKHSKLDTRIGVLEKQGVACAKALEAADQRAKDAEEALERAERAKEEVELEGIKDNSDALSLFTAKRAHKDAVKALAEATRKLESEKAEHAEEILEAKKWRVFSDATEIASKYKGVEASNLVELTDGSKENMEKLAKALSGTKPPKEPKPKKPETMAQEDWDKLSPEDQAKQGEKPSIPDSGDTTGGGEKSRYAGVQTLFES